MAPNVGSRSLGRPLPDAKRPRNPFDRSYSVRFNSKIGHLLPVFKLWAPAGSHVKINRKEFIRSFDINTSSFVGHDHFLDFFAVKVADLWSYWDNWYLNINDMHTSFPNAMQTLDGSTDIFATPKMRTNLPAWNMITYLNSIDSAYIYPGTGELQYGTTAPANITCYNSRRLLNLLGYPITVAGTLDSQGKFLGMIPDSYGYVSDKSNQVNNGFYLAAYQKIYFEHYRNFSYEQQNPFYYNFDWLGSYNGTQVSNNLPMFLANLCQLRAVNWRKDFFQAAYPALDYIPADSKQTDWSVPDNIANAFAYLDMNSGTDGGRYNNNQGVLGRISSSISALVGSVDSDGNFVSSGNPSYHTHSYRQLLDPSAYNVQAIRAAFALDKLRRASAYANQHVKDQYEARFGFKYKGDTHESVRIGSFKCSITPFEVTQTSPTSGAPLGTIGGKGLGSQGFSDEISFDCQLSDYIILGLSYFVPRLTYDSFRFDPFVIKFSRNDFFQPEFENLGLQPVYQKLISWSILTTPSSADAANNVLRFYQTRYQEYKTEVDKNFGLFNRGCQLSPFTSHFNLDKRVFGLNGLDWRFFKVLPDDVDNMFVTQADPTELTDQFYGQIDFSVKCTQLMSVHGQPDL